MNEMQKKLIRLEELERKRKWTKKVSGVSI
jgi:hypothetical protein